MFEDIVQFVLIEGFWQEIGHAAADVVFNVVVRVAGGHGHDGGVLVVLAEFAGGGHPVEFGDADVHQDQVVFAGLHTCHRFQPVAC